jgi:cell division protein FtsB
MNTPALQLRSRMPRIAGAAVERARLTVVPRRRTRAARMPFVALVSLVLLMGVIGLLLFNTSMQQASFATTSLEEQATTLSAREQTLQMELDVLRDPQHVAERAQEMGLVQPCGSATLSLADGKVLGTPCAPGPGTGLRLQARPPAKPAILNPPVKTVKVPFSSAAPGRASDGTGRAEGRNDRDSNDGAER